MRFGYAHFAFLGQESVLAAQASECAAEQDKFWEYHDLLFASQSGENQGAFTVENLKKFAGQLKLKQEDFDACLDSGKYADLVTKQTNTFQQLGVSSTPSFVINGQPLIGAQPFESFKKIIDEELTK